MHRLPRVRHSTHAPDPMVLIGWFSGEDTGRLKSIRCEQICKVQLAVRVAPDSLQSASGVHDLC